MIIAGVALVFGATLGFLYRVFVILLASVFLIIIGVIESINSHSSLGASVTLIVIYIVCLQFGYMVSVMTFSWANRKRSQILIRPEPEKQRRGSTG